MNKLTALLLAGVMAACCVPGVSAAQTQEEPVAVDKSTGYRLVTTLNVKQGTMLFYPYNLSSGTTASFRMENETKNTSQTIAFKDFYNHPKTISISSSDTYKPLMGCGSGLGGGGTYTYENTGGRYDVIKVKVSDFISELNKDGSSTRYINVLGKNVTYKFTEQFESNGDKFYSALFLKAAPPSPALHRTKTARPRSLSAEIPITAWPIPLLSVIISVSPPARAAARTAAVSRV